MYVYTLDIAHPPLTAAAAEKLLDDEAHRRRQTRHWCVMKIIHGSGASTHPGGLKEVVRNRACRKRKY